MQQEPIFVQAEHHQLFINHLWQEQDETPVLMLHGTIENGKIYYTASGKGLACFLAKHGFEVFAADYRGKGQSKPSIAKDSDHGQYEIIHQDIPTLINFVFEKTGKKLHVICHSWGGVMLASSLAKFPELTDKLLSIVCFGTKRTIYRRTFHKWWKVTWFWNRIAPRMAKRKGYIDAVKLKFGADNETYQFMHQCVAWVKPQPWVDPTDKFNYARAAKSVNWPPVWHLTGKNDDLLGFAGDVKAFIAEAHPQAKFSLLSKDNGNARDYDHIDILTAKDAQDDHFPQVVSWLKDHS